MQQIGIFEEPFCNTNVSNKWTFLIHGTFKGFGNST
jgi:hypothetical protein